MKKSDVKMKKISKKKKREERMRSMKKIGNKTEFGEGCIGEVW